MKGDLYAKEVQKQDILFVNLSKNSFDVVEKTEVIMDSVFVWKLDKIMIVDCYIWQDKVDESLRFVFFFLK